MVLLKTLTGVEVEDMLQWCGGVVASGIGGSGWRLCVSSVLFYLVQKTLAGSSDDRSGLVRARVHGQLPPMCYPHRDSPST